MEPLTIFAAAVGFIGIFHLLSTAVTTLEKGRTASVANTGKTRSDWYCFFKMSDLLGKDGLPSGQREEKGSTLRDRDIDEQKRQEQARRPRLHA